MIRRGLRLELVAAFSTALALTVAASGLPAMAFAAQATATQTTLSVETHDQAGRTKASVSVTVTGDDGLPANGAIALLDHGRPLAGAALNAQAQAIFAIDLAAGEHSLSATYAGDASHRASVSAAASVQAQTTTTPDFQIAVAPATLTLTPGQSGTVVAAVTPENASALTAPMFVTLSCSGLPDESSCSFTPENVEILPNATAPITSNMLVVTQLASSASVDRPQSRGLALAILLPGALGLGGLAFSFRRRRLLHRLSLLALVALVSTLGATACNARYDYHHHGPPLNPATPAGTYTVDVTAQSSNGVTAVTHTTTLAFTVQ
jgi:hypothetical protein